MDVLLPKPGCYVVAVSGGVDSVSLLHILRAEPGLELIVAHFDHGIREDSGADRQSVEALAESYDLPFVFKQGKLGPKASEADARKARYDFLQTVRADQKAEAIITAHHQDDVLETAILNMLRGTGRKGLTSLKARPGISRPLLKVSKQDLINYAQQHKLQWREDSTNQDTTYLRNYIRHTLLPRFSETDRNKLINILTSLETTNQQVDAMLMNMLPTPHLDKALFNQLPHDVAREVMAAWLRGHELRGFDRPMLERLVVAAKTAGPGKKFPVLDDYNLEVHKDFLALKGLER